MGPDRDACPGLERDKNCGRLDIESCHAVGEDVPVTRLAQGPHGSVHHTGELWCKLGSNRCLDRPKMTPQCGPRLVSLRNSIAPWKRLPAKRKFPSRGW